VKAALVNRIRSMVTPAMEAALLETVGQYTDFRDVFHSIQLGACHWVGVVGDGANGSYEWFSYQSGVVECSDCGFGDSAVALREVLVKFVR
jgi:hypothetical protein